MSPEEKERERAMFWDAVDADRQACFTPKPTCLSCRFNGGGSCLKYETKTHFALVSVLDTCIQYEIVPFETISFTEPFWVVGVDKDGDLLLVDTDAFGTVLRYSIGLQVRILLAMNSDSLPDAHDLIGQAFMLHKSDDQTLTVKHLPDLSRATLAEVVEEFDIEDDDANHAVVSSYHYGNVGPPLLPKA